jgi:hypothetical protein
MEVSHQGQVAHGEKRRVTYTVNVSSIQDFMSCRYRWLSKWVLNRIPRSEGRALTFGKLVHKVYEDVLTRKLTMSESIDLHRMEWICAWMVADPEDKKVAEDALTDIQAYTEALGLWEDQYEFDIPTLEVEQPFRLAAPDYAPDIEFIGRPDRVGVLWGKLVHVQNRSLGATTHFDSYTRLAKRHLHELVYAYALQHKYPQYEYGGTVMNLLRKAKYRSEPTKAHPEGRILRPLNEILWQGIVNYSPEDIEAGVHRASMWAQEMRACEYRFREHAEMPLPNERQNAGFYGNKEDEYFKVLIGQTTLDDDKLFKDRQNLYE